MSETISAKNIVSSLKKLAKSTKGSSINEFTYLILFTEIKKIQIHYIQFFFFTGSYDI